MKDKTMKSLSRLLFVLVFLFQAALFSQSGTWTKPVGFSTKVFDSPGTIFDSKIITELKISDSIFVTGIHPKGKFFEVLYQDKKAYIRTFELVENKDIVAMNTQFLYQAIDQLDSLKNVRRKIYQKHWGKSVADKIIDEQIWIGMTTEMCTESWGAPSTKSKTVSEYSITEIWQYGSSTLFFENAKLKGWTEQD
jgi:hypothetical protein